MCSMIRLQTVIFLCVQFFVLNLNGQFDDSSNSTTCYTNKFNPEFEFNSNNIDTCVSSLEIKVKYQGKPVYAYWSDGEASINRKVYYSGSYQLYFLDSLKCLDTSVVLNITLKGNPISVYSQNGAEEITLCKGNFVTIYAYHTEEIVWNTGETSSYITVEKGGPYYAKSKSNKSCVITSDTIHVTVVEPKVVSVKITGDSTFCLNDSCTLEADTKDSDIYWYPYGNYGNKITVKYPGVYYFYNKDSVYGCNIKSQEINIKVKTPEIFNLCMITNDSGTAKNKLVWESKAWVTKYQVFRETNISGEFELLAELKGASQDSYIDTSSQPRSRPYTYYIDAFDSCGNSAFENRYYRHTTLHLTANLGVSGENNLNWSDYVGIYPINSYNVYRSNDNKSFVKITSLSSSVKSFSDFNPPKGSNRYYIGIDAPNNCSSSGSTALVSNTVAFGILSDTRLSADVISVSPNPITDVFTIQGPWVPKSLKIYTAAGTFVQQINPEMDARYHIGHLSSGVYLLEFSGNFRVKIVKI